MAARRRCAFCRTPLPKDARATRKFCDDDCRRGREKPKSRTEHRELGPVTTATDQAIADAVKEKRIGVLDVGTVAAIRVLARKIDEEQERWDAVLECARMGGTDDGGPAPKPPPIDNVSIPTYLRYAESLGLTPSGRKVAVAPAGEKGKGSGGGKLGNQAASIPRPK